MEKRLNVRVRRSSPCAPSSGRSSWTLTRSSVPGVRRGRVKRITVDERRARLAVRHRLAPGHRAGDVVEAARSVACLHGTDPATVYLSSWARMDDMTVPDLDRAIYADRSLVKHLAMRRTLFVFPRELLPFAQAGASIRVADAERRRLVKEVEAAGLQVDGERWLADACEHVLAALAGGREATSSELRKEIALLEGAMTYGEGRSWGGQVSVGPRVLTILSAEGRIVRGTNDGWLGRLPSPLGVDGVLAGRAHRGADGRGGRGGAGPRAGYGPSDRAPSPI